MTAMKTWSGALTTSDRVKSRVLDVPEDETWRSKRALFSTREMALVVPEELDLDQFHPWLKVPEDLRNTQARMMITRKDVVPKASCWGRHGAATALQPR